MLDADALKLVVVYSLGIVSCSVCAPKDMSKADVKDAVNLKAPTGIESDWDYSENKFFKTGQGIPCECEDNNTRQHWLFNC